MKKYMALASIVLSGAVGQAAAAPNYAFTDLTPNAYFGIASGINNRGQIAGLVNFDPVIWDGASQTVLEGIGGSQPGNISETGYVGVAGPAIWKGGTQLVRLASTSQADAAAVNSSGAAVGMQSDGAFPYRDHAVAWSQSGQYTQLPQLSSNAYGSRAYAINDSGVIVGNSAYTGNSDDRQAVVWKDGVVTGLGFLSDGVKSSNACAVNPNELIVGSSDVQLASGGIVGHAALWNNGAATDLGALFDGGASSARGINGLGQIVGAATAAPGDYLSHAILWDHGNIIDLNQYLDPVLAAQGWVMVAAWGINDSGTIVGTLVNPDTDTLHAYKLTLGTSPVPEPETWGMLLVGLACIALAARKTRRV